MKVYVLRNCRSDMTSRYGFVWPESGFVECPDWDSNPKCGNGLHGFLWGKGDSSLLYYGDCNYLIVEVDSNLIVDLGDKVKFPQGNVVFCTTDKYAAGAKMIEFGADPATCMFAQVTSGDYGNNISGRNGNSISGYYGTSTSGHWRLALAAIGGLALAALGGIALVVGGTAQTGKNGMCILMHYTENTGYIKKVLTDPKANVKYQLNSVGEVVEI